MTLSKAFTLLGAPLALVLEHTGKNYFRAEDTTVVSMLLLGVGPSGKPSLVGPVEVARRQVAAWGEYGADRGSCDRDAKDTEEKTRRDWHFEDRALVVTSEISIIETQRYHLDKNNPDGCAPGGKQRKKDRHRLNERHAVDFL